jgi:hypothetical protein
MSPGERQAYREEMHKRWQQMSPEEREASKGMMRNMPAGPKPGDGQDNGSGDGKGKQKTKGDDKGKGKGGG